MIYLYLFGTCFHFIYVFMIIGKYFNECQTCISSESKISSVISDPDAWIIKYAEFSFEGKSIISHFQIVFQKVCKFHNKLFLTVLLQK